MAGYPVPNWPSADVDASVGVRVGVGTSSDGRYGPETRFQENRKHRRRIPAREQ